MELFEGSERESAVGRGQDDRSHPPDQPAHAAEQAGLLLGVSGELRRIGARQYGRTMPRPWQRLDRSRHSDGIPRVRQHVAGPGKDHADDVDVPVDEPTAVRSRLLLVQQQVGRLHSAGCGDESRRRHRAEHGGRRSHAQLHVSRLGVGRLQQSAAQHLAGVAHLRDRRAQLQGRLPGGLRGVPADPERRQPTELHVQQRRGDAIHDARRPARAGQSHALRRLLRTGSVDARAV